MEEDIDQNIDIHIFGQNFADGWTCLPSLTAPHLNLIIIYVTSIDFQFETLRICFRIFQSQNLLTELFKEALKLAKMLVRFPREALCADRKSVFYATFNADSFYDALTYEYSKGVKLQIMKDSIEGAKQFLQGKGRKGSFDDYLD